jgi:aquaporin Z
MKLPLLFRQFMAETYGTFVVMFSSVLAYAILATVEPFTALLASSVVYGMTYVAMHYTLGHISGGQFNPMLTVAAVDDGRITSKQGMVFIAAQVAAALVAGLMVLWITSSLQVPFAVLGYGSLSPLRTNVWVALVIELFVSYFITYVYLALSQRRLSYLTGIAVGLMMMSVMMTTGLLTGGHANPARVVATLLFAGSVGRAQLVVYIIAPLVGSLLARWFYKYFKYVDTTDVA